MAKDPLDLGTGINLIDAVERGTSTEITTSTTNNDVSYFDIENTKLANGGSAYLYAQLFDGDNVTSINLPNNTPIYVRLKNPTYVNFFKLRSAVVLNGSTKTATVYYSAATNTTPPSTGWTSLSGPNYDAADPLGYAYTFRKDSGLTSFVATWFKITLTEGYTPPEMEK